MSRITVEELQKRIVKGSITEAELSEFFVLDRSVSGPFDPKFKLNTRTVKVPGGSESDTRSAQLLNSANWISRVNRKYRYYEKIRNNYEGPKIVSEGDSWFQYPLLLKDTIDQISDRYAVYSLGAAGDLLERMADRQEYLRAIEETGATILLFSGGGNDLVANGALATHLESYHKDLEPADYLLPSFDALLESAFGHYERILRQVHGAFPQVHVLCHGYDYCIPDNGRWLGKPMQQRGIRSKELQTVIARVMIDRFNRGLRRLCQSMPKVLYIDCRGTVKDDRWFDELHPKSDAYSDVASLFIREIRRIENETPTDSSRLAISGPFGEASNLHRSMMAMPDQKSTDNQGPRAKSLHVGLNLVDPAHYAGWDGRLASCENDANDMAAIAKSQGFETRVLLTQSATRDTVVSAIEEAAQELEEGDMFMFTIAGHGGILPDFNMDEDDPADTAYDESLCLYDFQIIDDELYHLWTKFKQGVRVLMVADTCHSGNMVRFNPLSRLSGGTFGMQMDGGRVRKMPLDVAIRVWQANLDEYKAYARNYERVDERIVNNPLTAPIGASVLQLGACKEEQLAGDGPSNGAFTAVLKQVWNDGEFDGNYQSFIEQINQVMTREQQTPQLDVSLVRDKGFIAQVPFTLWQKPRKGVAGEALSGAAMRGRPFSSSTVRGDDSLLADEGTESDILAEEEIEKAFAQLESQHGTRSAALPDPWSGEQARAEWQDYPEFVAYIAGLGLDHFTADELLVQGSLAEYSTYRTRT